MYQAYKVLVTSVTGNCILGVTVQLEAVTTAVTTDLGLGRSWTIVVGYSTISVQYHWKEPRYTALH